MANPPRKKGTAFETEILMYLTNRGMSAHRTAASSTYDLRLEPDDEEALEVLVTRPDRGRALATVRLFDLIELLALTGYGAHIECKRYKSFAHHTIFEEKFGVR